MMTYVWKHSDVAQIAAFRVDLDDYTICAPIHAYATC